MSLHLALAIALTLGPTGAAVPTIASDDPDPRPPMSASGDPFDASYDGEGLVFYSPGLDAEGVSPYLNADDGPVAQLNPATIALCNAGFGDVSVQRFDEVPDLDHVDLFCGNTSAGYVHIRANHELDWQTVVNTVGGGALWDDFMVYAVGSALWGPAPGYPISVGNGKLCYTAPVVILDENMVPIDTYNPTVIISQNNKLVITAYPTHTYPDC